MYNHRVWLYAFNGINRVVTTHFFMDDAIQIRNIRWQCKRIVDLDYGVVEIVAMDERYGLSKEFRDAINSCDISKWYEFKDMCEREGVIVWKKEEAKHGNVGYSGAEAYEYGAY